MKSYVIDCLLFRQSKPRSLSFQRQRGSFKPTGCQTDSLSEGAMTLQQEIIQALGAKPQIDAAGEIRRSVDFLKSYLQTYPLLNRWCWVSAAARTQP
jgi:NAD+ synthase